MPAADRGNQPHLGIGSRMSTGREAFVFPCEGDALVGVIDHAGPPERRGVLIVVGGPQYRAGSHRQFTLLARHLANHGIPAMRFDYRGMGDSTGAPRTFEHIEADIKAAIDAFMDRCPHLTGVVLWGLCDAASAICFYASKDARVQAIVLANPWVRTSGGEAKTRLRHYYLGRTLDPVFWRRMLGGEVRLLESLREFAHTLRRSITATQPTDTPDNSLSLPDRMAHALSDFSGRILIILSENDITAQEFDGAAQASPRWRNILGRPNMVLRRLEEADHTFSRRSWRDQVAEWSVEWVVSS